MYSTLHCYVMEIRTAVPYHAYMRMGGHSKHRDEERT